MSSKAYQKFLKTIRRCESVVASYDTLRQLSQTDSNISAPKDIVRGAVVLAVAALDAYVTEVFAEKLVHLGVSNSTDKPHPSTGSGCSLGENLHPELVEGWRLTTDLFTPQCTSPLP